MSSDKTQKKKRGPGRPPSKKAELSVLLQGIAKEPEKKNAVFELRYCNPITFKNIYSLFKNYNASVIRMRILKTGVIFISQSQSETTPIFVHLDGHRVHHFYSSEVTDIYLKLDQFYDAFNSLDKKGTYICSFMITNDNKETLHVCIEDKISEFEHNYEFELIHHDETIAAINLDDYKERAYPLAWVNTAAMFKKIIQTSSVDGIVRIQKDAGPNNSVSVSFEKGRRTAYTGAFKSLKKIQLRDEIPEGKCLNISLHSKNITGFTKSTLGENVSIAADFIKPFCMKTAMDFNSRADESDDDPAKPAFIVRVFVPVLL